MLKGSLDQCLSLHRPQNFTLTEDLPLSAENRIKLLLRGFRFTSPTTLEPIHSLLPISQRRRILILTNLYPPQELGGYGRSLADFAFNLFLLGHTTYTLTSNAPYLHHILNSEKHINRELLLLGSYQNGLSLITDQTESSRRDRLNLTLLSSVIDQFKPHACLAGNLDLLNPQLLHLLVSRSIPCFHHFGFAASTLPTNQLPFNSDYYYPLGGSLHTVNALRPLFPEGKNINVIYTSACTHLFEPNFNIPLPTLRIAYAGLLMTSKGPHLLVEALNLLSKANIAFTCEFAGACLDSNFLAYLKGKVSQYKLESYVTFLGELDRLQLSTFYERNNIFVFPSIAPEGFGIVQAEALSAGMLVISSGLGGASEVIFDHINGRRFSTGDFRHLYTVISEVFNYPRYHTNLMNKGARFVRRRFDISVSTSKLSDLILNSSVK